MGIDGGKQIQIPQTIKEPPPVNGGGKKRIGELCSYSQAHFYNLKECLGCYWVPVLRFLGEG